MKKNGFTLIEVLVALFILAIGFLGVAGLQLNALKNNQSSLQRTQASMLAYFMMDQMRANRDEAIAGNYNVNRCDIPSDTSTLAKNDLIVWMTALKNNISNSDKTCGEITCDDKNCRVTIKWDDSRAESGIETQTIQVESIL